MRKRRVTKSDVKAPKRRRFVAGLVAGKSMRRAALDAGYTTSMADNAGRKIMPGARAEFKQALNGKIPQAKLIQRIVEGLDAKKVSLAQFEGEYTDQRYLVDHSERRRHVELALKLLGFLTEKIELSEPEAPPKISLNVHFTDPAETASEKLLGKLRGEGGEEVVTDPEPGSEKADIP